MKRFDYKDQTNVQYQFLDSKSQGAHAVGVLNILPHKTKKEDLLKKKETHKDFRCQSHSALCKLRERGLMLNCSFVL